MRKLSSIFLALLFAGSLAVAAPVFADSSVCGSGEVDGVVKTGTDGADSVSVCVAGVGSLTAAKKGDAGGYVAADGDATNPDPLDGYLAVSDKGLACGDQGGYSYTAAHVCDPQP